MARRIVTALLRREGDCWVGWCPELDCATRGDTIEEARAKLRMAGQLAVETGDEEWLEQRLHTETYLSQVEVEVPWLGPGRPGPGGD